MSLRQSATPLQLKLQPSRLLTTFIISTHVLTFSVLWLLPVHALFILLFLPLLIASIYRSLKKHVFERHRIHEVICDSDSDWKLFIGGSREVYADLQANSYRHPFISILNFKTEDRKKYSVILLPDSVDKESFRKLRVLLF